MDDPGVSPPKVALMDDPGVSPPKVASWMIRG